MSHDQPTFADVERAAARITSHIHHTPVLTCAAIDQMVGARLFFKAEHLQRTGSFKLRGACNAVLALGPEQAKRGVATHSAGNHGQALALAAGVRAAPAWVVMPRTAAVVKQAAVAGYGAVVELVEPTLAAREAALAAVLARTGATAVHPYDDALVIAGQATAAHELVAAVDGLDALLAPVSGGGLLAGTALAAPAGVAVFGCEPAGDDDAARAMAAGRVLGPGAGATVADGLAGVALGVRTFAIIRQHVRAIALVGEASIVGAMKLIWERMKQVVEPAAAVPLAALLEGSLDLRGARIGIILSGGNVDMHRLPWALRRVGEEAL